MIRNIFTGLGSKLLLLVAAFLNRTFFIKLLGANYTGINGLFTNILSILSLADLGIESVLTYKLYSALKDRDEDKIAFLVHKYKKIYSIIGIVVLGIGLAFIPFLKIIVNSDLDLNSILIYYVLHVVNSAASYFFVHNTIVLVADQKKYYDNIVTTIMQLFMYLSQLIYLYYTKDYIGYLVIQVFCTVLKNLILSIITQKKYPYITKKVVSIDGDFDLKDIVADTKATFIYKIGGVLLNHTDNILISMLLGTIFVGYYSNYYLLIQYVAAYIYVFYTGTMASIGNLNAERDKEKSRQVFKQLQMLFAFLACFSCSAFYSCVQDCVVLWIGEEYLVNNEVVVAILCLFWGNTVFFPVELARETMGLFKEVRLIMIPAVIINIFLSFLLSQHYGMAGILFATSISKALTIWWYEAVIVCRRYEIKIWKYYITNFLYILYTILSVAISYWVNAKIPGTLWGLFARVLISAVVVSVISVVLFWRTNEFRSIKVRIKNIIQNRAKTKG